MTACDVHPNMEALYSLENVDTGDCYYACDLSELHALLAFGRAAGALPPCGHEHKPTAGTWWDAISDHKPTPPKMSSTGTAASDTIKEASQRSAGWQDDASPHSNLKNALLHVLFACQDLNNDKTDMRYQRWQTWAVSWLRELVNGHS